MFKRTAQEVIAEIPDDLTVMKIAHPNGILADTTREHLLSALQMWEDKEGVEDTTIASINHCISQAERMLRAGHKSGTEIEGLANDVVLWFTHQLLNGELTFADAVRVQ